MPPHVSPIPSLSLGPEWKDHLLEGEWAAHRECHVGGDFLRIYRLDEGAGKGGTGKRGQSL